MPYLTSPKYKNLRSLFALSSGNCSFSVLANFFLNPRGDANPVVLSIYKSRQKTNKKRKYLEDIDFRLVCQDFDRKKLCGRSKYKPLVNLDGFTMGTS